MRPVRGTWSSRSWAFHAAMDSRASQVLKSLRDIRIRCSTTKRSRPAGCFFLKARPILAILQAFARKPRPSRPAMRAPSNDPTYIMLGTNPAAARSHYHGLKEALPDLKAAALFDRLDSGDLHDDHVRLLSWKRREIENYLCSQQNTRSLCASICRRGLS